LGANSTDVRKLHHQLSCLITSAAEEAAKPSGIATGSLTLIRSISKRPNASSLWLCSGMEVSPLKLDDVLQSFNATRIGSGSSTLALQSCCSCGTAFIVKKGDADTVKCNNCTVPVNAMVGNPRSLSVRHCAKCKTAFSAGPELEYTFECYKCVRHNWIESEVSPDGMAAPFRGGVAVEIAKLYRCDHCTSCYNSYSGLQNHKRGNPPS
jgi:hypothetical protein